jgi:hypothetical protein
MAQSSSSDDGTPCARFGCRINGARYPDIFTRTILTPIFTRIYPCLSKGGRIVPESVTAFFQDRIIARGAPEAVTHAIESGWPSDQGAVQVFDDRTGRIVDLDLWDAGKTAPQPPPRRRGRPKLGVAAREVTLLPSQWEWLGRQPGGASATLRRLVEAARKAAPDVRAARDSVYHFLTTMAGDRPGYEEALRALYRGEADRFRTLIAGWPDDVRNYAEEMLAGVGSNAAET